MDLSRFGSAITSFACVQYVAGRGLVTSPAWQMAAGCPAALPSARWRGRKQGFFLVGKYSGCYNTLPIRFLDSLTHIRKRFTWPYRLGRNAMHTVTKKELVDRIADKTGFKRVLVREVVQELLDEVINELGQGNRLEFRDFGVFETKLRAARIAQNPKTLERVSVPAKRTVKFKTGRLMKVKLQEGLDAETAASAPAAAE